MGEVMAWLSCFEINWPVVVAVALCWFGIGAVGAGGDIVLLSFDLSLALLESESLESSK